MCSSYSLDALKNAADHSKNQYTYKTLPLSSRSFFLNNIYIS